MGESGSTKEHLTGSMEKPLEIVNQSDLISKIEDLIESNVFSSVLQSGLEEPEPPTSDAVIVPDLTA